MSHIENDNAVSTIKKMIVIFLIFYFTSDLLYHSCDISVLIIYPSWMNRFNVSSLCLSTGNSKVQIRGTSSGGFLWKAYFQLRVSNPTHVCSHCVPSVVAGFTREIV